MFPIVRYGNKEHSATPDKEEILRKLKQNAKARTKLLKRNSKAFEENATTEVPVKKATVTEAPEIETKIQDEDFESTKDIDFEDADVEPITDPAKYDPLEMFKSGLKFPNQRKNIFSKNEGQKLPEWVENPYWIETDVNETANFDLTCFEHILQQNLKAMGVERLFPVQTSLIPALLYSTTCDLMSRPNDICVCSPTGSGKTLAFAIPIVNYLMRFSISGTCALVVVPTIELAKQVHAVFVELSRHSKISLVLLGSSQIETETQLLKKTSKFGIVKFPDVIVSTPGRLAHFLEIPDLLCMDKLRFLVIDEADRILDIIKQSWLQKLKQLLADREQSTASNITVKDLWKPNKSVQKLLFSATLSTDPEQLKALNLFRPRLFISKSSVSKSSKNVPKATKYITPPTLHEYTVFCEANIKPLVVVGLLVKLQVKKALCFAGSVESARRLHLLLNEYVKSEALNISCIEFSSLLSKRERKRNLNDFNTKKECVLVCSDAAARGLDAVDVEMVILYDPPQFIETYIHRAGRASRAGREGSAYSLVTSSEMGHYKKVFRTAGKHLPEDFAVGDELISELSQSYEKFLSNVQQILQDSNN